MFIKIIKSKPFIIIVAILLLIGIAFVTWKYAFQNSYDTFFAKRDWIKICENVNQNKTDNVKVEINNQLYDIDLSGCLSEACYQRTLDRMVSPPTPYYGNIIIQFSDGSPSTLYNWETEIFSISYRTTYYEIKSELLYNRLKELHKQ